MTLNTLSSHLRFSSSYDDWHALPCQAFRIPLDAMSYPLFLVKVIFFRASPTVSIALTIPGYLIYVLSCHGAAFWL